MSLLRRHGQPLIEVNPTRPWMAGSVLNAGIQFNFQTGQWVMAFRGTTGVRTNQTTAQGPVPGVGGYMSSIGGATSPDGIHWTVTPTPLLSAPYASYENKLGCEDPRFVHVCDEHGHDQWVMFYSAVESTGPGTRDWKVRIACAISDDFKTWTRRGIVGPDVNSKAAVLFPEKINGEWVMFYTRFEPRPDIVMQARFRTLDDLLKPTNDMPGKFDNASIVMEPSGVVYRGPEIGAVPIWTKHGWLLIYCAENTEPIWTIDAVLLDLQDPSRIIGRLREPLLAPTTHEEVGGGLVNNVVFAEGAALVGNELIVIYGAGDQGIYRATCNVRVILGALLAHPDRMPDYVQGQPVDIRVWLKGERGRSAGRAPIHR